MNKTKYFFLYLLFVGLNAMSQDEVYNSENLVVHKMSEGVYQHISYLETESYGRVACNGMIVFDKNEALIFDTPINNNVSLELINWIENSLNCEIIGVIPTHFHSDCLGGLGEFHKQDIPSYAHNLTIKYAKTNNSSIPQNSFDELLKLSVGNKKVIVEFFGKGHTSDNVIGYIPGDEIIFGGCLVKSIDAGKGNLEDATVSEWPETIKKIKEKYPTVKVIIPGHGKPGGIELLDYTIDLFKPN